MQVMFERRAWEDYQYWCMYDRQMLKKINAFINDILRDPFGGIGQPEPLKHHLSGFWSRRINLEHRIVYVIQAGTLIIAQCRHHY